MHSPAICLRPKRPVRGLVFDMDGTILDTRPYHMASWRALVDHLGLGERAYRLAEQGFGRTNRAVFQQWFTSEAIGKYDLDALSAQKEALFRDLIHGQVRARAGFMELLDRASRSGIRIGLATSGPRENVLFLMRELGVLGRFDSLVWWDPAIRSKPHPEAFLLAARRMDVHPARCIGVEDSTHGFLAVRKAGMTLVAVAEQPQDLLFARKWTPLVMRDFWALGRALKRLGPSGSPSLRPDAPLASSIPPLP